MKKVNPVTILFVLLLTALLLDAWLCHCAAKGQLHSHWLEWHNSNASRLTLIVLFAIITYKAIKQAARKIKAFAGAAKFLIVHHKKA